MLKRLGVLGWPVAHSRSPAMHRAALAHVGLDDWTYQKLPCPPEVLAETVRALGGAGFVGANVTIPHKEAALAASDEATATAREVGAANTLTFRADGTVHADNTDAPGFLAALPELPRTAMVLGAGGSARAVVWALRTAGAHVMVWNRTPERAAGLGAEVVDRARPAELLVNCTSVGLDGAPTSFKELPLEADDIDTYTCVADLVYRSGGTQLTNEAAARGCAVVDGLEVLVRQGALSFEAWTHVRAPLDVMRVHARGHHPHPDDDGDPTPEAGGRGGHAR